MTFRIISILLLLMTYSRGYSQSFITENVRMAWDHILELKPDSAIRYLETEKLSNPSNPSSFYYSHYALFLQALISGDVSDYNQFNEEAEILTRAIRDSGPQYPEYLYFLSSMHLQRTFLNIYHGEYWQGIRNLYVARKMIRQNSQNWPGFVPNLKIAGMYLEYFLDHYKGTNLVRIACHKLSWHYLIRGDTALYISYKRKVLSEGSDLLAADKQATAEASGNTMPDVQLLKARLLFDAGMYDTALETLHNINVNELGSERDRIEYTYRFARVCHKLAMIDRAKALYLKVVSENAVPDVYFAPYSALQLGLIAEQEGDNEKAKMFYETCLEINRGQYSSGIAGEAKNRLERLKK